MKINLITGMFQVELCDISVTENSIVITSNENNRIILFTEIENISVTRHIRRKARFEINLKNEIFEGFFLKKDDADRFANSLKEAMGSVLEINFHGQ